MLITCPGCSSAFRIDIDRVGPEGRSVRCGACREPWFVSPEEVLAAQAEELGLGAAPAAPDADADPERAARLASGAEAAASKEAASKGAASEGAVVENVPPAPRRPVKARGKARGAKAGPAVRKGLAGLSPAAAAGLAILAAVPLACLARVPVVRALPQTAGLYARIGLPVNLRGLELRDVLAYRNPADAARPAELVVEGDLVGIARGDAPVPSIAVELRDAGGRAVVTYAVPAPRSVLGEAETARFRARFPDPPAAGRSVEVRFAGPAARAPASAGKPDAGGHGAPSAADPRAAPEHPPAHAPADAH